MSSDLLIDVEGAKEVLSEDRASRMLEFLSDDGWLDIFDVFFKHDLDDIHAELDSGTMTEKPQRMMDHDFGACEVIAKLRDLPSKIRVALRDSHGDESA